MAKKSRPEAEYLKSPQIGLVIAKGMAVTYKAQPENPIDFFARWLLNQSQQAKNQIYQEEQDVKIKESQDQYTKKLKVQKKEKEELEKKQEEKNQKILSFQEKQAESKDLEDELQNLVTYLKDHTGSTAVYIGKVVKPKKSITDEDNDTAHIDEAAQPQIQFVNASSDHEFMVDKILTQDQGITYDLFREGDEPDKPVEEEEEEEGDEEEKKPKKEKVVVEKLPKHLIVDECVREPRIHYYDVPKLGSYVAVKLEYNSCLFEEAFDEAVVDHIAKEAARAEQLKQKIEWEEAQNELKREKEEAGEEYIEEEKNWEDIQEKPFKTYKVQYVVCLNTMGQDRMYTDRQKLFALRTIQDFRDRWEQLEVENLKSDVMAKIERQEHDKIYKESHEAQDNQELEKKIEEAVQSQVPGEGEEALTDEDKHLIALKARFVQQTRTFYAPDLATQHRAKMERMSKDQLRSGAGERAQSAMGSHTSARDDKSVAGGGQYFPLVPEQWKDKIRDFRNLYVIKYTRIWQAVFYLLKYRDRQYICERDTNCLHWKKAKSYLNDDFFAKIGDYWPIGPKEDSYKEYEKMKFIQKNLEGINEEEIDEYSAALGKLHKWVKLAIEVRIEDVKMRRNQKKRLEEKRQKAIEAEEARKQKRDQQHDEEKAKFNEIQEAQKAEAANEAGEGEEGAEKQEEDPFVPEFDSEAFYQAFDEENYPIDIPDEVEPDIDNDFNIPIPEDPVEE